MSFAAILKKDLRECLPWLAAAVLIVLTLGSGELLVRGHARAADDYRWSPVSVNVDSKLLATGGILSVCSLLLAVAMAFRHFFVPAIAGEWGFLVHRAGRPAVLAGKVLAGFLSQVLLGCAWSALFAVASRAGVLPLPPSPTTLAAGWISVAWGVAFYLGLSAGVMSSGGWYGRKTLAPAFVPIMLAVSIGMRPTVAGIVAVTVAALLLPQLIHRFNSREF